MNNGKYKILVVDDVEENRKIVEKILFACGYDVITTSDGLRALKIVDALEVDLILLDIMMPVMSGIETCRYLKVEPKTASIPVIFLTANTDKEMLAKAYKVGGSDYIRKPFFREELIARVKTRLELRDYEKNLEQRVEEKTREIAATQVELMYNLGGIAEGHSQETANHVRRVAEFTYKLARLYGVEKTEALLLKDASSLHDIGKLGVLDSILHKEGKLTTKEYTLMKQHVNFGSDMLKNSTLPLFKVANIVASQHHEKYDGSGYPNKLKGDDIHIYGRIVAIADVFDALSFKRAYKNSWSTDEVLSYVKDMRGKHFDPKLVDLFFENINDFLKIYSMHIDKIEFDKQFNQKKRGKIMEWLLQEI